MKDLSKYISNEFERTPSLNNYITEKILIGKNTKFSKKTATVFLVKSDDDYVPIDSNGITFDFTSFPSLLISHSLNGFGSLFIKSNIASSMPHISHIS